MLTQNKERVFQAENLSIQLEQLNQSLKALDEAKKYFTININLIAWIIIHQKENLNQIKNLISSYKINFRLINLDINEFKDQINKVNEIGEKVIDNQISNMSNNGNL